MTRIVCVLIGSLALATAACGGDTDGGGAGGGSGSTTSSTASGTGATGTSATGATTSTSSAGTTSTTSTSTGGGGCCKVIDDIPDSCAGTMCGSCVNDSCAQQTGACFAIQGCEMALQQTFLPCMCDAQVANDMAAEDACISAFEDFSAEAAAVIDCVQQNCLPDCTL
jgi:hypothetical protein